MVTALDQPSDVDRAVDAGTDDFLSKRSTRRNCCCASNRCYAADNTNAPWIVPSSTSSRWNEEAMTAQVLLQPKRARPFFGRHPWSIPAQSPQFRATQPTARLSSCWRTAVSSWLVACTTARASFACACSPGIRHVTGWRLLPRPTRRRYPIAARPRFARSAHRLSAREQRRRWSVRLHYRPLR